MSRGRLITIEGIDGAGKTTLAAALPTRCGPRASTCWLLREPGGVPAAERIRELVIDPELHVTARTEALLYAAARAQLVEEAIEPLLRAGTVGPARPVHRLLARVPGRRPGARDRRGPRDQRVRDPDGRGRTARCCLTIDSELGRARSRSRPGPRPPRARAERFLRPDGGGLSRARCRGPRPDPADRCHAPPDEVLAAALRASSTTYSE